MGEENRISEWNEANLKMKRLHDAQERINYCKRDPTSHENGKFNYEWWIKDIDVLFGEGKAKYSPAEKKKVERLKDILFELINYSPPHTKIVVDGVIGSRNGYAINQQRLRMLLLLTEEFEDLVKELNDKHGLSTKNRDTSGLF